MQLYKDILGVDDLKDVNVKELHNVLQPDSLLERFAAKKAAGLGNTKDFLEIKGMKGQLENEAGKRIEDQND